MAIVLQRLLSLVCRYLNHKNNELMNDMRLYPLTMNDLDGIAALQPERWGDVVTFFRYHIQAPFCFPMKLSVDGIIVGAGSYVRYGTTVWLALVMVHPGYRNRGIGAMVTRGLLEAVARLGYETVLLDATDLGYPVYKKLGFEVVSEYIHMEGMPVGELVSLPALIPFEQRYAAKSLQLDQQATGEQRTGLLQDALSGSLLYRNKDQQPEGIYMPGFGRKAIIAATPEAGTALLAQRMLTESTFMFPDANLIALDQLNANGYTITQTSRRMILGKAIHWKPENIYNTTGGAFG